MRKHALILVSAGLLGVWALAGCGQGGGTVAEINGKKVSQTDFVNYVSQAPEGPQLLWRMLDDRLSVGLAQERGVEPTDDEVNQRLEFMRKAQDLDAEIKERGLTTEQVKEQLRVRLAREKLALQIAKDRIKADEVKKAYQEQKSEVFDVPRVRVELIAFQSDKAAQEASKKLAAGATLEKVAEDTSNDEHGPVVRELVPKSGPRVIPELAKTAFATPEGKTSKPFRVQLGMPGNEIWVILKSGERLGPAKVTLAEAEPTIRGAMAMQMAGQDPEYRKQLREARRQAKLKVTAAALKQVEKDFRWRE